MASPDTCSLCLPAAALPPGPQVLSVLPALDRTRAALRGLCERAGLAVSEPLAGVVGIELPAGALASFAGEVEAALTGAEQRASRCLLTVPGQTPGLADAFRMEPLAALVGRVRGARLAEMLEADRLTVHFQPIVDLSAPHEAFAYECLVRGVDDAGTLVPPDALFSAANASGQLFQLDRAARLAAIRGAARHGLETRVFINFTPNAVYHAAFCLRTTVAAVQEAGLRPQQVVFEVTESEEIDDVDHLLGILDVYRASGFAVALDDLGAGYSSLNLLTRLRPDYVKLDRALVSGVDADAYKGGVVEQLLALARRLGIRSVAEGVETEAELAWLCARGADLAQGYLFAPPAALPPSVRRTR
jgi:EAL domain-containing protein (putative c-di-GMP-specific phosphodiesterase class I)